jgi:hypothetical protein
MMKHTLVDTRCQRAGTTFHSSFSLFAAPVFIRTMRLSVLVSLRSCWHTPVLSMLAAIVRMSKVPMQRSYCSVIRVSLAAMFILLGGGIGCSGSSNADTASGPSPTSQTNQRLPTADPPATPLPDLALPSPTSEPAPLGTDRTVGMFTVRIHSAERIAWLEANPGATEPSTTTYAMLDVSIRLDNAEASVGNIRPRWTVYGADGAALSSEPITLLASDRAGAIGLLPPDLQSNPTCAALATLDDTLRGYEPLSLSAIKPGEAMRGWISFKLPQHLDLATLTLELRLPEAGPSATDLVERFALAGTPNPDRLPWVKSLAHVSTETTIGDLVLNNLVVEPLEEVPQAGIPAGCQQQRRITLEIINRGATTQALPGSFSIADAEGHRVEPLSFSAEPSIMQLGPQEHATVTLLVPALFGIKDGVFGVRVEHGSPGAEPGWSWLRPMHH